MIKGLVNLTIPVLGQTNLAGDKGTLSPAGAVAAGVKGNSVGNLSPSDVIPNRDENR